VRSPHLQAPLDTAAEILSDLEALAPFMRPLTPGQWRTLRRAAGPHPIRDALMAWASKLRIRTDDGASATSAAGAANIRSVLGVSRAWMLQRFAWLQRRTRAQRALLASGLLVAVVAALALLAFLRQPQMSSQDLTLSSSAARTALAGTGAATALATETPASSATSGATPGPAPKLTLACAAHGATATLTIKNAGAAPLTWQAQPPPTLTVSPGQGALQAGQSATVQVSAVNKKSASGTITVIASHDNVSTQDKVSCR
jgi:hypothetical protein